MYSKTSTQRERAASNGRVSIERFITQLKEPGDILPGVREELMTRGNRPALSLDSLPDLNDKIWGLRKGLTVVGGRTSQGKSSLALQMAYDLADQNNEVLFLSLEMSVESLMERLYCNTQKVANYDITAGRFATEQVYQDRWGLFTKLMNIPLKLSCGLGKTFDDINGLIELLDPKPKVIIVDYIQAIRKGSDERRDMDDYILKFREICILNNIAGVLVSQNSRKVFDDESKEPSLANLKGTGCIHPDSLVMGIPIKQIVENKTNIKLDSYDYIDGNSVQIKPDQYFHTGIKKCLKIKTKSGKEIILSRGTKLFDGKVWRKAKTFRIGERILVQQ